MNRRIIGTALLVLALLSVGVFAGISAAQTGTGTSTTNAPVTLAAGQTMNIPVNLWCANFGIPFPTAITGPTQQATPAVVRVLNAAQARGATTSDPYQTQLAVWYALDGTWHDTGSTGHALAQQIVSDAGISAGASATATVAATAVATATGNSTLSQLVSSGTVKVTINNFNSVPDTSSNNVPPYHGTANLSLQNTSNQSVTFTVDGAIFTPTNGEKAQTLIAQANQTSNATATATSAATSGAAAAAVTTAPTTTAVATAAPTTAATTAATTVAQVTAEATPATLPTTGGSSDAWVLLILAAGALSLFAGLGLNAARRTS